MQLRDDTTETEKAVFYGDNPCPVALRRFDRVFRSFENKYVDTVKNSGDGLRSVLTALERNKGRRLSPSFEQPSTFPILTHHTKTGPQPEGITGNLFKGRNPGK